MFLSDERKKLNIRNKNETLSLKNCEINFLHKYKHSIYTCSYKQNIFVSKNANKNKLKGGIIDGDFLFWFLGLFC